LPQTELCFLAYLELGGKIGCANCGYLGITSSGLSVSEHDNGHAITWYLHSAKWNAVGYDLDMVFADMFYAFAFQAVTHAVGVGSNYVRAIEEVLHSFFGKVIILWSMITRNVMMSLSAFITYVGTYSME